MGGGTEGAIGLGHLIGKQLSRGRPNNRNYQ